ncbi:TadE/TadG family type IV pilus assembly protein [Kitasatospora sp. GP82]|uniref:TadE/TadG family type IV pilus assembly protein n=1 Tax=Kitasatospora sp. GP82 TaxID=3035089 RepID=UPI002473CEF2|nr:TadE/TadG family type IV pilus assembly protein [Kitasatospora sp. GP82]MDH6125335.1 Flp pilus assembly protein TadG [Kitasatospora sp. GP82]
MRRRPSLRKSPDAGSVAVEAAIIIPVVVIFVMIAVVAGRIQTTGGVVDAAARSGARAASLARTPEGARQAADDAAQEVFRDQRVPCSDTSIAPVEYGTISTPTGQLDTVSVTVSCKVALDYLSVGGVPGSRTMTGRFTSVIDRYRGTG